MARMALCAATMWLSSAVFTSLHLSFCVFCVHSNKGTNMWTPGAALPRPRGGVNGIAAFGCFFVWGGEGTNTSEPNDVFPDHDVYNPRTNMWTSLPDLPTPIHGVTGAAFVNGLIYMPGGRTMSGGSSGTRLFQVYRPMMSCD